jgi:hypothetical protein
MTPRNFREFAEKRQKELAKLLRSDLPRLMVTKAMQHFRAISPGSPQNAQDDKTIMTKKLT